MGVVLMLMSVNGCCWVVLRPVMLHTLSIVCVLVMGKKGTPAWYNGDAAGVLSTGSHHSSSCCSRRFAAA